MLFRVIFHHRVVLPAQAVVEGQTRGDFPVVLGEEGVRRRIEFVVRLPYRGNVGRVRIAEQKRFHGLIGSRHAAGKQRTHDGAVEAVNTEAR